MLKAKPAREKMLEMRFGEVAPHHVASAAFLFQHAIEQKQFKIWLQALNTQRVAELDLFVNSLLLESE